MASSPCPTCGRHDFADDSYMKRHHSMAHGESIAGFETECTECGSEIVKVQKEHAEGLSFCDKSCEGSWRERQTGEDSMNWDGGVEKRTCPVCDRNHNNGYRYRETCSEECLREYHLKQMGTGEDHPSWKGGYGTYYGSDWPDERSRIRDRDNNTCQVCEDEYEDNIPVHHIIPVREFDDPNDAHFGNNMVQVCLSCHPKIEVLDSVEQRKLINK